MLSDEQIDGFFDESPFFSRLSLDKKYYEVGKFANEDWRDVITNDEPESFGFFDSYEEAEKVRRRLHVRWVIEDIKC